MSESELASKPDIKLIALDLDGTVVNDELKISAKTLEILQHLIHDTDVRVVIATGRMYASALPFAKEIGVKEPIIAYQGAMIKQFSNGQDTLFHNPIPMPLAQKLMQFLVEGDYAVNLYMDDQLVTTHTNSHATYYARAAGVTPQFSDDLMKSLVAPPTKLMVIDDTRVDFLMGQLAEKFVGELTYCRSRSNFCEMINATSSKWEAVSFLMQDYGLTSDQIMCIGDQGNDISMIGAAGLGIAMGNAPDDVKGHAKYVTKSIEEDGVAHAIEKFVLNRQTVNA